MPESSIVCKRFPTDVYKRQNWQEFKELTGGTYRGMVEASDYIPLKDIVRVKGQMCIRDRPFLYLHLFF